MTGTTRCTVARIGLGAGGRLFAFLGEEIRINFPLNEKALARQFLTDRN